MNTIRNNIFLAKEGMQGLIVANMLLKDMEMYMLSVGTFQICGLKLRGNYFFQKPSVYNRVYLSVRKEKS